jgi:hypothetical protein
MTHARLGALAPLWLLAACSSTAGSGEVEQRGTPVTYWQDIAPLVANHCLQCHVEGGIAPLELDDYASAKAAAPLMQLVTRERTMPPWSATSDGSCGEFSDSIALSDAQIQTIADWVEQGAQEGARREIEVPALPTLGEDALELASPNFTPVIQGGELAAYDEYRCFELDAPAGPTQYITGYDVLPGSPEIVHHVLVMLVDPDLTVEVAGEAPRTNLEQMRALDARSPDREGWPCFGMAGEHVKVDATPVAWAPGQGVVRYPEASGVPLHGNHKIIVQVHYNLADARNIGKTDQTRTRLRLAPQVERVGRFALPDLFLGSLDGEMPATLPPGQRSTTYSWSLAAERLGVQPGVEAQLYGVMPHMHQLGRKYQMTVASPGEDPECAVNVERWDFHWQRMYFYAKPFPISAESMFNVNCDYDTRGLGAPVKPGWGTRNEMCLASLYITMPFDPTQAR